MKKLMALLKGEEGLVAIEYALIAVLIAVAIYATVQMLGGTLNGVFTNVDTKLKGG